LIADGSNLSAESKEQSQNAVRLAYFKRPSIDWGQNLCECVPLQQLFAKIYVLGTNGLAFGTHNRRHPERKEAVSGLDKGPKDEDG